MRIMFNINPVKWFNTLLDISFNFYAHNNGWALAVKSHKSSSYAMSCHGGSALALIFALKKYDGAFIVCFKAVKCMYVFVVVVKYFLFAVNAF